MDRRPRPKQKVLEVLSLYSVLREPVPGKPDNLWIAQVMVEPLPEHVADGVIKIQRIVNVTAIDELSAYTKIITEGV